MLNITETPRNPNFLLTNREIPVLDPRQLALFTSENLRSRAVGAFDAHRAAEALQARQGAVVFAIDLGGDKLSVRTVGVSDGKLQVVNTYVNNDFSSKGGAGYIDQLKLVAQLAQRHGIKVGISTAGSVEGTTLAWSPNLEQLVRDLDSRYDSNFELLFGPGNVSVDNDAVAAIKAGAVSAVQANNKTEHVILVINGGGFGGAVYSDGMIYANEPGHIPVIAALNPYQVTTQCGVQGATHVCLERIAASGAGVEVIFSDGVGAAFTGREISQLYQQGSPLAGNLYDLSTWIMAHGVIGLAQAHGNLLVPRGADNQTAIVYQGGGFKVPGYPERVTQVLTKNLGYAPQASCAHTTAIEQNGSLHGAAIAALNLP